jgi:hypothetical protein
MSLVATFTCKNSKEIVKAFHRTCPAKNIHTK